MAERDFGGFKPLIQSIKWAAANGGGSPMAGMAAMLGVPWMHRSPGGGGAGWQVYDPQRQAIYAKGTTPPPMPQAQKPPTTGGDDPPLTDEEQKKADLVKAGLAPWYVDWLNTSGKYGGVPPTPGLLG
jgi:hypothetical protein